jgi:hypothetical protein
VDRDPANLRGAVLLVDGYLLAALENVQAKGDRQLKRGPLFHI